MSPRFQTVRSVRLILHRPAVRMSAYICAAVLTLWMIPYTSPPAHGVTLSEGGPIVFAWPLPCFGGVWTIKLTKNTLSPTPIPVFYPYPAGPPVVKSSWLPPLPGVTTLGTIVVPGGGVCLVPSPIGPIPAFFPAGISTQYGTAVGL